MFRKSMGFGAALLLALTLAPGVSARNDLGTAGELSGKYLTEDGGYVVFAVDDRGGVDGFYVYEGAFGQLQGRLVDGAIEGRWFGESDRAACDTTHREAETWGRFQLSFGPAGRFVGLRSLCDGALETSWDGQR